MSTLAINGGSPVHPGKWDPWPRPSPAYEVGLREVARSGIWGYDGPQEDECTSLLCQTLRVPYGHLVSSGTAALQAALMSLDIGSGDEVIVPCVTWQATASAVLDSDAIPVLVDIDPQTYCIDVSAVDAAITQRTKCIVPVHLDSAVPEMDALLSLAKRHDLAVVEDCAHQPGGEWKDKCLGTLGHVGCYSFQSSKLISAGEGGAAVTQDRTISRKLYAIKNCGRRQQNDVECNQDALPHGANMRITEFQAAVLIPQISALAKIVEVREKNARVLDEELAKIPGVSTVQIHPQVTKRAVYNYTVRCDEAVLGVTVRSIRKALAAELNAPVYGIYPPLHLCRLYKPSAAAKYRHLLRNSSHLALRSGSFPVAERAFLAESVLIPHTLLAASDGAVQCIVEAWNKVLSNKDELRSLADSEEPSELYRP